MDEAEDKNKSQLFAFHYAMKVFSKAWSTRIEDNVESVWNYFSNPANLSKLTPESLNFEITTQSLRSEIYPGQLIRYKVSPFGRIKLNWVTQITAVEEQKYFIDEQIFGPFSFWHHEHRFATTEQGVLMTDTLHYGMPLGWLGRIVNQITVSRKIDHIFEYRRQFIHDHFSKLSVPGL